MVVSNCQHDQTKKHGKDHLGNQRHRCILCGKTFIDRSNRPLGDMRIDKDRAIMALRMMLEGSSVRTISRLTGLNLHTLCALLLLIGERCQRFLKARIRDVQTADVEVDELWSFVGCKEKHRNAMRLSEEYGDCYTFIAIDRESKLILAHLPGKRDMGTTLRFLDQLREAIAGNCHITSDGFPAYYSGVPSRLWDKKITFAQLIKIFGKQSAREEARYSPAPISGLIKKQVWGKSDESQVCTSHIERFNLSLRMGLRRFTRLTNAHSKSLRHHHAAIALWITYYNFCRVHSSLGKTPAVMGAVATETWTVDRLLNEVADFD